MLRAIIIDDHAMFTEMMRIKLDEKLGLISVVATSIQGEDVFPMVKKHKPDIVFMDYYLPGSDGMHLCRRLMEHYPALKIIVVSAMTSGNAPQKFLKLGVKAVVSKNSDAKSLVEAIEHAAKNKSYVCDTLREGLLQAISSDESDNPFDDLSDREMEVVRLLCQGMSSKEIAFKLNLSDKTVASYKARVVDKLNVKSDMELFKLALANNLITPI